MSELLQFPFIAGILAALLHVLSGPDHLAAVTPLALEVRKSSWRIGVGWGLGHLAGMLIIGGVFIGLRDFAAVEKISVHSEKLVGAILILVGGWSISRIWGFGLPHRHCHFSPGKQLALYCHDHASPGTFHPDLNEIADTAGFLSAGIIGIVHGLAGVAHFILMLPTLSFASNIGSAIYLAGFAAGTITAMTVYTMILGNLSVLVPQSSGRFCLRLRWAGGSFAVTTGIYWLFIM